MTDRQIDPSTLRDGDIVRAKRGEHGVVEGVFHSYPISSGWGIGSEAEEDGLFAWNDKGWTITSIIRPVLVKGDRVVWTLIVTPKQGTYVGPHDGGRPGEPHLSVVTNAEGRDIIVETDFLTRLPTAPEPDPVCPFPMGARVVQPGGEEANVIGWEYCAECGRWEVQVDIGSGSDRWAAGALTLAPEPAPIEVGDWWADEGGWPCVVVKIGPTGNPFLRRWTSEHPDKAPSPETLRAAWTRLDGPPEPPVGSVYVIRGTVWESTNEGHWRVGMEGVDLWPEAQAYYDKVDLATLQIVHTLGVE